MTSKQYSGVRYRGDGEPLNDLERILHSDKAEVDFIRQSLVELKEMVRDIKLELLELGGRRAARVIVGEGGQGGSAPGNSN